MLRLLNAVLVMCVIGSAIFLYMVEHKTRKAEREIVQLKKEITQERENINLLNAEWSRLARPQRLEKLAREHLKLGPVQPQQVVTPSSLATRLPDRAPDPPHASRSDPIAEMLKAIQ